MFAERQGQSVSWQRLKALALTTLLSVFLLVPGTSTASAEALMQTRVAAGAAGLNGLIAFADRVDRSSAVDPADIFTVNPDGTDRRNVTDAYFFQGMPAWSPDGRRLLYVSNGHLVERQPGGGLKVIETALYGVGEPGSWAWAPEYSPDGSRIVYCLKSPQGETDLDSVPASIVVARADGRDPRIVVDLPGVMCGHPPSWSPDGRHIAFNRLTTVTDRYQVPHVWVVEPDGENPVDITPTDVRGANGPSFMADGRILFQSYRPCTVEPYTWCGDIFTMSADGTDEQQVTFAEDHPAIDYQSAEASPDQRKLLVGYRTSWDPPEPQSFGLLVVDIASKKAEHLVETQLTGTDWQARCTVRGTRGDDVLLGTAERDLMCGLGGDDVIRGLGGDDVLFGHGGNDRVMGGAGRDIVVGNSGRDRCDSDREDLSRAC